MINKLYKLKKTQVDQLIAQKLRLVNKTYEIDNNITLTKDTINHSEISQTGIISNIHYLNQYKSGLSNKIDNLVHEKQNINEHIISLEEEIVILNQECEQYNYMLLLEKKKAFKKMLKDESTVSEEYIQSKLISHKKELNKQKEAI
jgi:hypothetical protein